MSVENTYTAVAIHVRGKGESPLWQVDVTTTSGDVTIPPTARIQCDGVVYHPSALPSWFAAHNPARLDTTEDGVVTSARFSPIP